MLAVATRHATICSLTFDTKAGDLTGPAPRK